MNSMQIVNGAISIACVYDPQVLEADPFENPFIKSLYDEWLDQPGSEKAKKLMHTVYHPLTTSKRLAERKVEKFEKNISKRGLPKKGYNYSVELIVLGLLVFVIVGSYIFQMIRAATSGEIA
ncbi:hypothetical protein TEA_027712 [Camellia sinensis var. sinensis]|uniref:Iron hydrogenase small subunit domain-containing protein n=1 Tax=Camellia sinensis var. sinensis TaxID=542762 RepID=A0A4S4DPM8_CAMSN|nr:hypothetical protein TEA_027712 [Camellia sinensis var. sinensis]